MNATREREEALIWDRALRRHDELCIRRGGCRSRENHARNDSVWHVRRERIEELEAQAAQLRATIDALRHAERVGR